MWEGACTLLPEVATLELPYQTSGCNVTVAPPGNGWFTAAAAWIGVMEDPTQSAVRLLYDPGSPKVTATIRCGGTSTDYQILQFATDYYNLHSNEFSSLFGPGVYMAKDWEQLRFGAGPSQNGEFFAKKSYERTISIDSGTLTEETWFFLKHTPDAPMPDCRDQ